VEFTRSRPKRSSGNALYGGIVQHAIKNIECLFGSVTESFVPGRFAEGVMPRGCRRGPVLRRGTEGRCRSSRWLRGVG
jgi:hypothetical protein